MIYQCPHCAFRIQVDDSVCGATRPCPSCLRPTVVPDPAHRARLAALFDLSQQRRLDHAEWTEVATHYEALGDLEKVAQARAAAARAFRAESARRQEATVADIVTPLAQELVLTGDVNQADFGESALDCWLAALVAALWLALALTWRPLAALATSQVLAGTALTLALYCPGERLAKTLMWAVSMSPPVAWRLHSRTRGPEQRGTNGADQWSLALVAVGAWLVGLTLSLYAITRVPT